MRNSTSLFVLTFLIFSSVLFQPAIAQDAQSVKPFDEMIVSPQIDLILSEGPNETVRLETHGVSAEEVRIKVQGKTLRIYLDKAKVVPKRRKYKINGYKYNECIYQGAKVKAYVTYRDLKKLEIRGEQDVLLKDPIHQDKFKLKLYGASQVEIAGLQTKRFKAILYGENDLQLNQGQVDTQFYRAFGENTVNAEQIKGKEARTRLYGESAMRLNVSETLRVSALGESKVTYLGNPRVDKGLIIGASVQRIRE